MRKSLLGLKEQTDMNIANIPRVALRGLSTTQAITNNPLNFVLDNLIRLIVKVLIPVPLASELIIYFKGPILAFFAGSELHASGFLTMSFASAIFARTSLA